MAERPPQIERILAGDHKAFEEFVKEHQRLVSHIVFRMVSNDEDRKDICQDVFLKVHQNLAGFRNESKLSTWVGRVAYNRCLNHLEKKKVPLFEDHCAEGSTIDSVIGEAVQPDEYTEHQDMAMRLRAEIQELPAQYRAIVSLYHLDEMTYKEIGEITKLPEGTVKSYLFRARKLLKERLAAKYQPEEL
ncbi:MAG: sigma-70 family RNA polymerase sigma factor [candidate division Zixibacteria bacterium]|nr:sigma-70 family RNA polymerase sigma factor [candidate division Zixibacteria bacterium]MDH3936320.1 sigma-70 family RNA polymerase sigma factor [candidate division Zixibacteria bacterium]MDH4035539.1 sigma-70 family RNA polymerase sigma factor [candidate division Zixibacteria bacterium]